MSMTLRQLVEFRERLRVELDTNGIEQAVKDLCNNLTKLDTDLDHEYAVFLQDSITHYQNLIKIAQTNQENLQVIWQRLDDDIKNVSGQYFLRNYDLEEQVDQNNNVRRTRKIYTPADVESVISQRANLYVDWHYPGLQIGVHETEWTRALVSCDPYYVVDPNKSLLDEYVGTFTPEYQRRIRPYHVKDINLSVLPQNQFGFVLCWNYLNYKGMETIKQWLQETYKVLRPGGIFMVSYNNADLPSGAGFAETNFMSYMPKSMLLPLCEMIGYELVSEYDFDASASWLELRKPGELKTVKAHQALGEIMEIK
jgi:hypothetical protein